MSKAKLKPENLPEALIWYYIIYTYLFYLLGAQYVAATLLGTYLVFDLAKKWWYQTEKTPPDERVTISILSWVWLICVLIIEGALIVGHLEFNLGLTKLIKSSIFWYRGWGLFPLFIFAANLKIRPQILYRAACILCVQSLILVPVFWVAGTLHLPQFQYVSPFKLLGGGDLPSSVQLFYVIDVDRLRLQLFTPWAPALGLVGNMYFLLAREERNPLWKWLGMVGAAAMVFSSVSRLGILCLCVVPIAVWFITNFLYPWVQIGVGMVSVVVGMFLPNLIQMMENFKREFRNARAGSSKVREALAQMALQRWEKEAPIWGHGMMHESGPAATGYRPIGSHHTWFGLLYIHGLVGCIAFAVAFFCSFVDLLLKVRHNPLVRAGLSFLLVLFLYSFGENIDTLAYLFWPGLLIIGIGFKQKLFSDRPLESQPVSG